MLTGFILTNAKRLADVLGVQEGKIQILLKRYIENCASFVNWQLIDASRYVNQDWGDCATYLDMLHDYRLGLGLDRKGAYNIPLFIIGGEDVIPTPNVEIDYMKLPADILYCFDKNAQENLEQLTTTKPYFAVGRLPITQINSINERFTVTHLSDYLDNSVAMIHNTIASRGCVTTTAESWYEMAEDMTKDIPKVPLSIAHVPVHNNMISSPLLDTSEYNQMYEGYIRELSKADVWQFLLHGAHKEGESNFYGESVSSDKFPVALQTSMLHSVHPMILNTNACHGGRYFGYDISDSMLLSALVNGTMLYLGASNNAYYNPFRTGYAIALMKYYTIYLHKGYPAAMALLKAKQDYYERYHDLDGDVGAMVTVLEFNLYGCPLLSMQPQLDMSYDPKLPQFATMKKTKTTYRPKTATPLFNSKYKVGNLHFLVKHSTDMELQSVYKTVESELYQYFHVDDAQLEQVFRLSQDNCEVGFRFVYRRAGYKVNLHYSVECDNNGNILTMMGYL